MNDQARAIAPSSSFRTNASRATSFRISSVAAATASMHHGFVGDGPETRSNPAARVPATTRLVRSKNAVNAPPRRLSSAAAESLPGQTTKLIEDVEVGDLVWAWDEAEQALTKRRVSRLFRHKDKPVLEVVCMSGGGAQQSIWATTEHPFWVERKGWVACSQLGTGDGLKPVEGDEPMCILDVKNYGASADVFNFEVEGVHNYFVGAIGVLVHNSSSSTDEQHGNDPSPEKGVDPRQSEPSGSPDIRKKVDAYAWSSQTDFSVVRARDPNLRDPHLIRRFLAIFQRDGDIADLNKLSQSDLYPIRGASGGYKQWHGIVGYKDKAAALPNLEGWYFKSGFDGQGNVRHIYTVPVDSPVPQNPFRILLDMREEFISQNLLRQAGMPILPLDGFVLTDSAIPTIVGDRMYDPVHYKVQDLPHLHNSDDPGWVRLKNLLTPEDVPNLRAARQALDQWAVRDLQFFKYKNGPARSARYLPIVESDAQAIKGIPLPVLVEDWDAIRAGNRLLVDSLEWLANRARR